MKRRGTVLLLALALVLDAPLAADAQPAGKVYRIGYLATRATTPPYFDPFRDALREQGWIEGQNIVFEWRIAEGKPERLPDLAADLARLKVDVIVATPGGPTVEAAKAATSTIPIVMVASHDAVATGLVTSLARPGGNITGTDSMAPDLDAKRLELLKELAPRALRVAILYNPNSAYPVHSERPQG
jgi:putative ABC transport system substrate-binding protein